MTVEELREAAANYAATRVVDLVSEAGLDPQLTELCMKCAYSGATFFQAYYAGHEKEIDGVPLTLPETPQETVPVQETPAEKPAPKKRGRKKKTE